MKNKLFVIIRSVMEVSIDEINEDSSSDTLENWDSLKHMSLILALEEEFNVQFTDEEIIDMVTVKSIIEKLQKKGG